MKNLLKLSMLSFALVASQTNCGQKPKKTFIMASDIGSTNNNIEVHKYTYSTGNDHHIKVYAAPINDNQTLTLIETRDGDVCHVLTKKDTPMSLEELFDNSFDPLRDNKTETPCDCSTMHEYLRAVGVVTKEMSNKK